MQSSYVGIAAAASENQQSARASSFAAQNVNVQTVANHEGFIGLAVQTVHCFLQQHRLGFANNLRSYATADLDCRSQGPAARYEAIFNWQHRITVDSDKKRSRANGADGAIQLRIVEAAIKANEHSIGFFRLWLSHRQVLRPDQVYQWLFANNIDAATGETPGNMLHRHLPGTEQVSSIGENTQALEFCHNLFTRGKRVVGQEQVLFVVRFEPRDKFPRTRQ